jgi:CheY-like chemotaxis protein
LLVVDDDVLTRLMVADELRASGYKVLEASSVEDAISILDTMAVHLIVADLHMPGAKGGLDVVRRAKDCRPLPKIILTSGKLPPDQISGLAAIGPFLSKPYLASRVLDLVRRSLDPPQDPAS